MILCFDIGGSRIKAAVLDAGRLTRLGDAPTPGGDFAAFGAVLRGFGAGRALRGISIAIAGVVDPETRALKVANIPCANGRLLSDDLAAAMGVPVLILNDADCFALAEARGGAGQGHRTVFGVILGTGVGGGLVIDGRLLSGAGGYSGEWGHGPVIAPPWDFPCGCGQSGCVDTVGGARGIERLHQRLHGVTLGAPDILGAWQAGEADACATLVKWLDLVAPALALAINITGVSSVPVGGGLSNVAALIAALDGRVRQMILRAAPHPLMVPAALGPDAGLIGAAEAGSDVFGAQD